MCASGLNTHHLLLGDNSCRKFLWAFTQLREATDSFVMSVRPSVLMEQLGSHRADFCEI